jgi:multicomponent Na+:H+ antiporter subunit E
VRIPWRIPLLIILWLLAWGEVSLANVLSGTAVAAALLVAFPAGPRGGEGERLHVSLAGITRLTAYVAAQLVLSNIEMTRQILRRRHAAAAGVLAHRLRTPSETVLTLMTSIIALSPGTMTADITDDSSVIYVHFFHLSDREAAHAYLGRLEQLVVNAIAADLPHRDRARTSKEQP